MPQLGSQNIELVELLVSLLGLDLHLSERGLQTLDVLCDSRSPPDQSCRLEDESYDQRDGNVPGYVPLRVFDVLHSGLRSSSCCRHQFFAFHFARRRRALS